MLVCVYIWLLAGSKCSFACIYDCSRYVNARFAGYIKLVSLTLSLSPIYRTNEYLFILSGGALQGDICISKYLVSQIWYHKMKIVEQSGGKVHVFC